VDQDARRNSASNTFFRKHSGKGKLTEAARVIRLEMKGQVTALHEERAGLHDMGWESLILEAPPRMEKYSGEGANWGRWNGTVAGGNSYIHFKKKGLSKN